jgi:hypothetical protein
VFSALQVRTHSGSSISVPRAVEMPPSSITSRQPNHRQPRCEQWRQR